MYLVNWFISATLKSTHCTRIMCNERIPNTGNEEIHNLCYSSNPGI